MKPVCHVDDTDSLAAAAAARATGAIARPEVTTINNATITCSATLQRVTQLPSPATAANTKATQSISALASRVGCGSFAQLKPPRHFGAERRDSPHSPIGGRSTVPQRPHAQEDGGIEYGDLPVRTNYTEPKSYSCFESAVAELSAGGMKLVRQCLLAR